MLKKVTILVALLAMVSMAPKANALTLSLTDLGSLDSVSIIDGGSGDLNSADGAVTFVGALGGWSINVSTGLSVPAIGTPELPELDLNSVNTSAAAGSLQIALEDEFGDINPDLSNFLFSIGGTTVGSVAYSVELNGSTVVSGVDNPDLGSFGFDDYFAYTPGLDDSDIVKIIVTIEHDEAGVTSFDAHVKPVPEPGTLLLLGGGLVGLAYLRKRKKA